MAEEIPLHSDGTPDDENAIRWIYEPGSFTPLARYEKGLLHYAVTDTVGRIQELLTEEGTIVWKSKQQLWGKEEGRSQEGAPSCRLRFPGQYEDDESGLFYNRYRYYDGDTGQYVSPDPIGLAGGTNPYSYVVNPLKFIDPLGLCKTDVNSEIGQGYHNETYAPKPVKPEDALDRWNDFLGPGPHTNIHPRTGLPDANRIVSADGTRSIRYGNHEMNSGPTKHHYHEETWTYDPVNNVMNVDNSVVRVPFPK